MSLVCPVIYPELERGKRGFIPFPRTSVQSEYKQIQPKLELSLPILFSRIDNPLYHSKTLIPTLDDSVSFSVKTK